MQSKRRLRGVRVVYALLMLLFLAMVNRSSALSVTVNEEECVYEYMYEGDTVSGNFVVVDHDIFWGSDHPGIDFTVTSPAGNVVNTWNVQVLFPQSSFYNRSIGTHPVNVKIEELRESLESVTTE